MATVTGLTAEKMQEIVDSTIVDANIVGDDLILTKFDASEINAGDVRGGVGPTGPAGPSSIIVCTSTTRPTGGSLFEGLYIYETDTDKIYVYDGSVWVPRGRGVVACTAATRPTAVEGLAIYETDTDKFLVYNGVRFDPPWNMPWGTRASHVLTTAFSTSSVHTTLQDEGLTFTLDEFANRRALLKVRVNISVPGGTNGISLSILRNGVAIANFDIPSEALSTAITHACTFTHLIPDTSAGTGVIYKTQIRATPNNTSITSFGNGTGYQRDFEYIDEGPNGVPE